jgi:outer membrane protein assembly factor BamD (BamD/ComL family)
MRYCRILLICCVLLPAAPILPGFVQPQNSRRPEIIRDTDVAEEAEATDVSKPKELNPLLAEQNINVGDFYFKRKNYDAAIQRYLTALEHKPDSVKAYDALARAYEKIGDISKAKETCRDFLQKYPDSPKSSEFRSKLAKLEKKLP